MIVPSGPKAGRSRASDSVVVSPRTPSSAVKVIDSRLDVTSTGTISSAMRPSLAARAARCCERAANSSCRSREMPSLALSRSVDSPIESPLNTSVRPS